MGVLSYPPHLSPFPCGHPLFLLPEGPLSGRILHEKLFGSILPALQDEPDVLPGFASVAGFYDDLVGCGGEGGRRSAEGKRHPPLGQKPTCLLLQVLHLVLDHSLKCRGWGVG